MDYAVCHQLHHAYCYYTVNEYQYSTNATGVVATFVNLSSQLHVLLLFQKNVQTQKDVAAVVRCHFLWFDYVLFGQPV